MPTNEPYRTCWVDHRDQGGCVFDGVDGLSATDCELARELTAAGKGRDDCPCWREPPPQPPEVPQIPFTAAALTANILASWSRPAIVAFAKHLLGEACQRCPRHEAATAPRPGQGEKP